jgi:hypothetical protein
MIRWPGEDSSRKAIADNGSTRKDRKNNRSGKRAMKPDD